MKKNIRKLPDWLLTRANDLESEDLVVACVQKIKHSDIARGSYSHIGLALSAGSPVFSEAFIPSIHSGRFSKFNLEGREVVHKDLPKVWKTYSWDAPNFGDYSNGYHTIDIDREVYQRTFEDPRLLEIKIELIGKEPGSDPVYAFRFTVDHILGYSSPDFEDELFFAANLLQENVGAFNIYSANATLADYLQTVYINWEILPPGQQDENVARILSGGRRAVTGEERQRVKERYELLESLGPIDFIRGVSGFRRYFGARFADDVVVFENIESGNALYVMFENWEELSQKSRLELLSGDYDGFVRIIHAPGWEGKLTDLLERVLEDS